MLKNMKFQSHQIKGDGIGRKSVLPTINLDIPSNFDLKPGVYAVFAYISENEDSTHGRYMGALHFGPRPTFDKTQMSLELYILENSMDHIDGLIGNISIEIVKYIREVRVFKSAIELKSQISSDVVKIREILEKMSQRYVD